MTDLEIEDFMLEYCDLTPAEYRIVNGCVLRCDSVIFNAKARRLTKIPIQFSHLYGDLDCSHLENVTDFSFIPLGSNHPRYIKVYASAQLNESFFKALLQRHFDGCCVVQGRYKMGTGDFNMPQLEPLYQTQAVRFAPIDFSRAAMATVQKYLRGWYETRIITKADTGSILQYVAIAVPYTRNVRYSYVCHRYRLCFRKANNRYRLADYIGQALYDYTKTQDFLALKAAVSGTRYDKYITDVLEPPVIGCDPLVLVAL